MTDTRAALLAGLRRVAEAGDFKLPAVYDDLTTGQRFQVREQYERLQDGLCSYCHEPLDGKPRADIRSLRVDRRIFPEGFFDRPKYLHHDHDTGLTLGAVHAYCNAVLWVYHRE